MDGPEPNILNTNVRKPWGIVPVTWLKQPFSNLETLPLLLKLCFFSLPPPFGSNETETSSAPQYLHWTRQLWSAWLGPIRADCGRFVNSAKVWWVAMCLAKLVFAPGSGEAEWSWTHANKRFCSRGQSCSLAPDLHSYTQSYCFPFVASCHSLCQSLIRTMSFRRLISHFSNFLTLHNERGETFKGTDSKGRVDREKGMERGNG